MPTRSTRSTAHGLPLNITRSAFDERFSGWFDRDPHRSQELKGAPATALASTNRHTMDDILERHGLAHKDLAAPHRIAMGLYVEPRHEIHTRLLRRKARCEVRSDGLMRLEDVQRVEWPLCSSNWQERPQLTKFTGAWGPERRARPS